MKKVQRFDYLLFKAHKDENGFLIDTPVVSRIGLQEYKLPDGTIQREFRPSSEVFSEDSLNSFRGKPITLGHVTVTPENAKKVTVGNCSGSAWADYAEGKVRCHVTIMDQKAIDAAEAKKASELSVGYTVVEIREPGYGSNTSGEYIFKKDLTDEFIVPDDWVEFDVLQTNIIVNHVAMVFKGRAGIAKLNLDSEQEFPYDIDVKLNKEDEVMTVKIKLDGAVEFDVPKEVATFIETVKADATAAKTKADSLEAERDVLQAKVEGIPAQIEEAVKKAKADADEHAALVATASEVGVKCDGLTAKEIKIAYVKEVMGNDISAKADAYIDTAFDIAKESDKMAAQRIALKGDAEKNKQDAAETVLDPSARLNKAK